MDAKHRVAIAEALAWLERQPTEDDIADYNALMSGEQP